MKKFGSKLKQWYKLYISVALVIIIIICSINWWYCLVFRRQADNINSYVHDNLVSTIEDFYGRLYSLSINLLQENQIEGILKYNSINEYYTSETADNIIGELGSYKTVFDSIDLIYLYIDKTDTVLSAGGVYSSRDFYEIYCSGKLGSYEKWLDRVKNGNEEDLLDCGDEMIQYNIMLNRVYARINDSISCGMIFRKEYIFPKTPYVEWLNKCNIYIYDINKRLMIYDKQVNIDGLGEKPEFSRLSGLSDKYRVIAKAIGSQYTAVFVFEKDLDIKMVRVVQTVSLIAIIINILIGVFIFWYLYTTKFRPLQRLAELLDIDPGRADYKFLEKPIKSLMSENSEMSERLKSKNLSVCNLILNKLLIGEVRDEYFEILSDCQIVFDKESFVIIIVNIHTDDDISKQEDEAISESIAEFSREMFDDGMTRLHMTVMRTRLVFICNTSDESEDCERIIAQKFAYIANMLNDKYNFVATVAVSNKNDGAEGISKGYLQALEVISKSELFDRSKVVLYSSVDKIVGNNLVCIDENELAEAIKYGNTEDARSIVEKIFSYIDDRNSQLFSQLSVGVIYTLIKTAGIVWGKDADIYELTAALRDCGNIDRVREICLNSAERQSECMKEKLRNKNTGFVEYIKKYIEENYSDSSISNEQLSELVHYSTIHINNLFKKSYGMTPMAYLTSYRLEMAKKLIADGMKINDVAERTGFASIRTFNRTFQNNVRMSPVEYKNHILSER